MSTQQRNHMSRRIGPVVIQVVEQLERTGEVRCSAGRPIKGMPQSRHTNTKALRRAVEYGLVTRTQEKPYVYRANPEWRSVLNPTRIECGRVSSVWDLAGASAP